MLSEFFSGKENLFNDNIIMMNIYIHETIIDCKSFLCKTLFVKVVLNSMPTM
jgi:hypothetical protein